MSDTKNRALVDLNHVVVMIDKDSLWFFEKARNSLSVYGKENIEKLRDALLEHYPKTEE